MTTSSPAQAYTQGTGTSGVNTLIHYDVRSPATTDVNYKLGTRWIDSVDNAEYTLTSFSSFGGSVAATWVSTGGGATTFNTLTGNTGGAVNPSAGNIFILGSGALSFGGAGSVLTGSITPGTNLISTIAGNSGGPISPTSGALSIVGSGAVAVAGAGSTLTIAVTPGTALISTLTGDSGGSLSPTTGNFNILGTNNQITSTGAASTLTLSIPSSFTAPGSITATTTLTATSGAITATNGNLVLGTAGNKVLSTSVASTTTAGANSFGTVTLVNGTATISTTAVTANSIIYLTRQSVGATGPDPLGMLSIGTISAGTSFVINAWSATDATALAATDVSVIGWMIVN